MIVQCFKNSVCASFHQKEGPLALASPSVKLRRIHGPSVFRHCHCLQQSNCQGRPLNQNLNQQFYLMCPSQILLRVARRQRWWWSWFSRNLREEAQPWHSEDYRSNHPTETPLQFTWKRQNLRQETRKLSFEIPLLPQGIFWIIRL